jgi:hypothetical protein
MYNEFTTEVDINRPDGILRSSDVDSYIEKALQPLIEAGKAFRRINIDRRTGIRSTRYAYQGGKNIQDSINAILAEMPASLGYDVDPATGNVSGASTPPPMSVTNQGRYYYNETRERILDPRTAVALKADALRAGGISTTDKASGYTTTVVRAGLSGETRRMRQLVDDTDAKYLVGELPSSALADGASPATIVERTYAQISRQANIKDAKQAAIEAYIEAHPTSQLAYEEMAKWKKVMNREDKAKLLAAERMPGTLEFENKIARGIKTQDAREDAMRKFIAKNPGSRLAARKRQQAVERRRQTAQQFGSRAIHAARNAMTTVVGSILTAITAGVMLLTKSYQLITQIGSDVRKRALNEARFNFAPDIVRAFEVFAAQRGGIDKDLLVRAAGGIQTAWSTPLNYTASGFNQLAPYLRENTVHLVRMATADGDANVLTIMSSVIDDLVAQSLKGVSGAKTFDPNSVEGRHRAFSGNLTALSSHNEAWGELMNLYWQDFLASGASNIGAWQVTGRDGQTHGMSFENWVTQAYWSNLYQKDTGLSSPTVRNAAQGTHASAQNVVFTFGNLATDIVTGLAGYFRQVIENLRGIIDNWLSPFFPVFAMKEKQRAEYLNIRSRTLVSQLLPDYEKEANQALRTVGYSGTLGDFEGVLNALQSGDTNKIPSTVNLEKLRDTMSVFTRYYLAQKILRDIETEDRKTTEDKNYVPTYIVATPEHIATVSGERALVLQYRLSRGAKSVHLTPPPAQVQETADDKVKQIAAEMSKGMSKVFDVGLSDVTDVSSLTDRMITTYEERIQKNLDKIKGKRGKWYEYLLIGGVKPQYDAIERDLRTLVSLYDKAGNAELAKGALVRLQQLYDTYPKRLDTGKVSAADLSAQVGEQIRRYDALIEYADTHTGLVPESAAQQKTVREMTVAEFDAKVTERLGVEADLQKYPELQSIRRWLAADLENWVHVDAVDEQRNTAMSDVIVNFYVDKVLKQQIRLPNTYGFTKDVHIKSGPAGWENVAAALEAFSPTQ